jgi:hypothetical protein
MARSVVAVSAQSLFLAEARIAGCINCQPERASTRFERLLDRITGLPRTTAYILPGLAICPSCFNPISESTMILPSARKADKASVR